MNELIERVAMAIHRVGGDAVLAGMSWEDAPEANREQARREARAAIEAMREPTDLMTRAGSLEGPEGFDGWFAEKVWQRMIDKALSD